LPQRFASVARRLIEAMDGAGILAGSQAERTAAQEICGAVGAKAYNLSGRVSLTDLGPLIRRMTIFVTNDSGPMHMAAALGVRTVALFGATDWVKTSPWSQNAIVVRRETACAPCMLRHCPIDHRCMERIPVSDVIEAIQQRWPELGV
jgi:heptosyltransferase-2